MVNFTIICAVTLIGLLIRARIYKSRQQHSEELTRELLARNETLAQYDQMKSKFLAAVAHEINTPLAVIAASSKDTLDLLSDAAPNMDEISGNQGIIARRVKMIDSILLDLMDTAAIENGRLSLSRQLISLHELLENVCGSQFTRLDAANNTMAYDIKPGLKRIWADPQRVEQVMINLLTNACKHTSNGNITIRLFDDGTKQIICVTDNGEGMDEELAKTVLKQYVSTKADYWRHGIGLNLCRHIVVAHGGEIWIDSEKGRGTSVSFSLPEKPDYE
jgi:signal transduction histidine kinase